MKQKDIYLVNLDPVKGSEQGGVRPIVIISGDTMNDNLGICIACPISSKVKNYASCVKLEKNKINNLDQDSEIITFQIRTISKTRLVKKIGRISEEEFRKVLAGFIQVVHY